MEKIYADNAATTKLSLNAFDEMKKYLLDDYSNPSQPYSFSKKSKMALKNARKMIAECINASPEEIFFTSGGSESDNWAIKCYGLNGDIRNIFTSEIEHHAVLNSCEAVNHSFVKLKVDSNGIVNKETLEKALSQEKEWVASCETSFVSIMMANNEIGTIEPIKELAKIAHKYGACFHTDAVQCVGHMKIDVKDLDIDMLSASAHKFNGPKGIGFLYIKKGTIIHQLINGGAQENGHRAGTENVASIVGMATALKENLDDLDANVKHITEVENAFVSKLKEYKIDFIRNGSEYHMPGIVNISIKNSDGEMLLHRLDLMGIYISTGSACDSVNNQVSHVIKAIKVPNEYSEGTIRISFGKDNTIEDAETIANAIKKIIDGNSNITKKRSSTTPDLKCEIHFDTSPEAIREGKLAMEAFTKDLAADLVEYNQLGGDMNNLDAKHVYDYLREHSTNPKYKK